jgi:hypothetical protein
VALYEATEDVEFYDGTHVVAVAQKVGAAIRCPSPVSSGL